ncbi:flavanone 3-dioxygenase [Legionella lansingensis]|uniref:2-oxoglutarate-dependent ethylene/succinate-forming enzyme n=1 Tax=Legionella lansingensis TaxID=45067 RepID=A0A0W0VMZ4_9GAMM|nr:2OG-Fe(II) oxygenase family protein [Legionella lansingensis]KTD21416.1 oxidoreductase, 2OG-Fe(II) oxygenase family [Legionella lansingensis]SNV51953.1 flavanone 3-dioxygenase [Legionella lansingensis]
MIKDTQIPVIDVSALYSARSERDLLSLAQIFREVYTTIGFAHIVNHGISQRMFDAIFEQSKLFHHLPEEEKLKIKQNEFFRGYMPIEGSRFALSTLGEAIIPNQSAAFILGFEVPETDPEYKLGINLAGPNQWPSEELLPDFKNVLLHYRENLTTLLRNLVRVFSLSLGQNYYALDKCFVRPTTFLRLQYYPAQPDVIPEQQYGIAPHTDWGALTLLAQDSVGGLQVKQCDGSWLDVPPLEGSFILNTGDMMRRMSNDTYISTPHRVINTSGKERYSIPFFFEPDMHALISPLTEKTPLYEPTEYADHIMKQIKNNYKIGAKGYQEVMQEN